MTDRLRNQIIFILGVLGLLISILSGASEHIGILKSFCPGYATTCGEAAKFTFFHIPVWAWGIAFYAATVLFVFQVKTGIEWIVPLGFGMEAALIRIMVDQDMFCVFCIANAAALLLLAIFAFRPPHLWRGAALTLFAFLVASVVLPGEHPATPATLASSAAQTNSEVFAKVGDEPITRAKFDLGLNARLFDMEKEAFHLKQERVQQVVIDMVLQKEAAAQGKTLEQYLDAMIPAAGVAVADEDVARYYEENQARLRDFKGPPDELMSRIRTFLEQQKRMDAVKHFAEQFYAKYGVEFYLKEPTAPSVNVDTEGSPSIGPPNAAVTVVEFSDYMCPACRQGHETVQQMKLLFGNKVRWVFKDFPLKMHKDSEKAALAARCAEDQGKFQDYQNKLYTSPAEELSNETAAQYARDLGLDSDRLLQCVEAGTYKSKIEKDILDAKSAGVDRTPVFIINGKVFVGAPPPERFKAALDEELKLNAGKSK